MANPTNEWQESIIKRIKEIESNENISTLEKAAKLGELANEILNEMLAHYKHGHDKLSVSDSMTAKVIRHEESMKNLEDNRS